MIASKSSSAKWAMKNLDNKWINLIEKADKKANYEIAVDENEVNETISFIDYMVEITKPSRR